ncbi:MAG: flavin reductase family protein [Clostridia bacterium]|nr:flavin reductase family protein [Clostridia bacterium]
MSNLISLSPQELTDNLFSLIGHDWMLITAADPSGKWNTMTASWGCAGILWNKPVAICFVRPQRYTDEFIRQSDHLTLSFFDESMRDALRFCGSKSGRDYDKAAETGLIPEVLPSGSVSFAQARLTLDCRRLYADVLRKDSFLDPSLLANYPIDDFHHVYVCEIEKVWARAE